MVFMTGTGEILLAIFVPLGIFLLVALFFYLFGNVYNGLVKRRQRVEHSWYELTKSLKRAYEMIPSLLQEIKMDKKTRDQLTDIYKRYSSADLRDLPPQEAASLDASFQECLDQLTKFAKKNDSLEFVNESRKMAKFSIPLYNHNVHDYQKFKGMLVNRRIAKWLGFKDGEEFIPRRGRGDTTIDFRLDDFIDKSQG